MVDFLSIQAFAMSDRGRYVFVMFIIIMTFFSVSLLRFLLKRHFQKKSPRMFKLDHTQYSFINHFMSALIYLVGVGIAIYIIPSFRAFSVSLFAGAGVLAIILGFASQQAVSNIISGIFIVAFRPFRVGDWIKVKDIDGVSGIVEDITLRHTVIKNFENKRIVIPNSVINNEVIENKNLEDNKLCKFLEMDISYDSNVDKAMKIMQEEAAKHPLFLDVRTDDEKADKVHPVRVKVLGFKDSAVTLRAWVWAKTPINAFFMGCDLRKSIKERFDRSGIEIPFPYRTIVYKKDIRKRMSRDSKKSAKKS